MKERVEHRVPLSDAALAALELVRSLGDQSGLVFPSPSRPGRPLSTMTPTKLLRDVGLADRTTVHGFRSAFRIWTSERTSAAHAVGSAVERSYTRSDRLEKRRALMDRWAAYVTGDSAKVVCLHGWGEIHSANSPESGGA